MMLLLGCLFVLNAWLVLGLTSFNGLVTATVSGIGLVGGCGYGALGGRQMIGRLRDTGVFRPTRKDLFMLGIAVVGLVAGFWLLASAGSVYLRLLILGGWLSLPAAWITQAAVLWRWELTSGNKVEYEGAWAIKATVKPTRAPT